MFVELRMGYVFWECDYFYFDEKMTMNEVFDSAQRIIEF